MESYTLRQKNTDFHTPKGVHTQSQRTLSGATSLSASDLVRLPVPLD